MSCSDLISYLDILGIEFQFNIKNSTRYKTILGGSLTIFLICVIGVSVWGFGKDYFNNDNPNFVSRQLILPEIPLLTINKSNFFFGLRITDDYNSNIFGHEYFEAFFRYKHKKLNATTGFYDLIYQKYERLEVCDERHIPNDDFNFFDTKSFWCGDINNIVLGGNLDQDEYGFISYEIVKCNTGTEQYYKIKCANPKVYTNSSFNVESYLLDNIVDPSNYTNPVSNRFSFNSQNFDNNIAKIRKFYIATSQLLSDNGAFLKEYTYTNFTQIESTDLDFGLIQSDGIIFNFDITISRKKDEYERSYLKIQDVAATIGGFINIAFSILRLFYYFYAENNLQFYLFDELLDLRCDFTDDEKILSLKTETPINKIENKSNIIPFKGNKSIIKQDKSASNIKIQISEEFDIVNKNEQERIVTDVNKDENCEVYEKVDSASYIRNTKKKQFTINQIRLKEISKFTNKRREKVDLNPGILFCYRYFLCPNLPLQSQKSLLKKKIYYLADNTLNHFINIINHLKSINQLNVIKKIILNENQCFMLSRQSKKLIVNTKPEISTNFDMLLKEEEDIKIDKLKNYLKIKIENNDFALIDKLLYDISDEQLKERLKDILDEDKINSPS